jgi:UDPglucose 6-dehydrogenase
MRAAPSRTLMEALWKAGAKVQAYDPEAMDEAKRIYGNRDDLILADSPNDALDGSDALVLVTEWSAFKSPDFSVIKQKHNQPVIFDCRNQYEPVRLRADGFSYYCICRL